METKHADVEIDRVVISRDYARAMVAATLLSARPRLLDPWTGPASRFQLDIDTAEQCKAAASASVLRRNYLHDALLIADALLAGSPGSLPTLLCEEIEKAPPVRRRRVRTPAGVSPSPSPPPPP